MTTTAKHATAWAAETFGFGGWSPQSALEFIEHCKACGFQIDVDIDDEGESVSEPASTENVRESGGRILVKHVRINESGFAPQMIGEWAVVAE